MKQFLSDIRKAIEQEDLQRLRFYFGISQLYEQEEVSASDVLYLLLVRISHIEGKELRKSIDIPSPLMIPSSVALKSLQALSDRKVYTECLNVRKHRNFIICLLEKLDKKAYESLINYLKRLYGYEHLWLTDLLLC